jgi:Zn-dependent protease
MDFFFIFQLIVLLFSVVVHEVAHGLMALRLGDHTARLAGRLTLNPLKHIDPIGSVILPLLLALIPGGVVFGWAKPVPYNPYNLKDPRKGGALVAAAGPLTNISIALIFAALFRFGGAFLSAQSIELLATVVLINIALAVFNLIPIPPLDGSKILFGFLPRSTDAFQGVLERYGFIILIILIFSGLNFLSPAVMYLFRIFTGLSG